MKRGGFSLLEVLAALIILALAYTAVIHLHALALRSLSRSREVFSGVLVLDNFLAGEAVEGVRTERRRLKIRGLTVTEAVHSLNLDNETVYFRVYERP